VCIANRVTMITTGVLDVADREFFFSAVGGNPPRAQDSLKSQELKVAGVRMATRTNMMGTI